ncbi:uncharacterized protein BXZ73DRAFT_56889 [Epithele typhae]|uniref:uncharacterized protein n=1 Tax=Epithele typhae TaxID=378194 RepID=UPI0020085471|nr:uncharacterized protein BXZ73DRAFT_56889 [Epithele typhae]KAH9911534.1 hypothetical protein BXZ73DRAFT_56889 [Epithele typhae]
MLEKRAAALQKRASRAVDQASRTVAKAVETAVEVSAQDLQQPTVVLRWKEGGCIPDNMRILVWQLAKIRVPFTNIGAVVEAVIKSIGGRVEGKIGEKSVSRIVGEGAVALDLMLVEAIESAEGYSISSDGTQHRKNQYDAQHLCINNKSTHTRYNLGVMQSTDHTSETQLQNWEKRLTLMFDTFNNSPLAHSKRADVRGFWARLCTFLSDHAKDQKKLAKLMHVLKRLCNIELRGEEAARSMSVEQFLALLIEECSASEGNSTESNLTVEQKALKARQRVIQKLGEDAFEALPLSEQRVVTLFIHAGCCMHKDLNATQGGNTAMVAFWTAAGLDPPVRLLNRDNTAAAQTGSEAAIHQAFENSQGGGTKVTELTGLLFNHREDTKGQQDSFRYSMEKATGKLFTFPDTSNTRFGSHGDAATVLVEHLEHILVFLEQIRDQKQSGEWTNLEANVWKALHDAPTLTELCVLSLYSQAVSHPYMAIVRGADDPNHLELGPLHDAVKAHIDVVIEQPDRLLAVDASHVRGALGGRLWDSPRGFEAVQELSPHLPHIKEALVAFLRGARVTWERFSSEYAAGGEINGLSAEEKEMFYAPATNDLNEGALGFAKVYLRASPNITLETINALSALRQPNLIEYTEGLTSSTKAYIRRTARDRNEQGTGKARRKFLAEWSARVAQQAREARLTSLETKVNKLRALLAVEPLGVAEIPRIGSMKFDTVKGQVRWYRQFVDTGDIKVVRVLKDLRKRIDWENALRHFIQLYAQPDVRARTEDELSKVRVELRAMDEELAKGRGAVASGSAVGVGMVRGAPDTAC